MTLRDLTREPDLSADPEARTHQPRSEGNMSNATALEATHQPPTAVTRLPTPLEMLDRAIESGASTEVLTKLMDLQERHERNEARRAFDRAISAAKAEIPIILTNREGHNQKRYADFAAYARVVDPILAEHGLSYRFRTKQDDKIAVTCILSHQDGHSEENTLVGPADTSGSKNAIQAIGSTLSYLQRYSLKQALGLAASDDDDGKAAGVGSTITDKQAATLNALVTKAAGADDGFRAAFLKWLGIEGEDASVDMIPARDFDRAERSLRQRISRMAKPEVPADGR